MERYIAEIAGKDSIAAVLCFASEHRDIEIIPTIAITGTEYGGLDSYRKSLDFLNRRLHDFHIVMGEAIYLQDGELWNYMNARYQYYIYKKYLFYTPCVTCHLYTHLLRIPVYQKYRAKGLITGERESHAGKVKINQQKRTLETFDKVFEDLGIEFIRPLRKVSDSEEVDTFITEEDILEHVNDVKCVMSGNLQGFSVEEGNHILLVNEYLEKYVLPVGRFCAERLSNRETIDRKELDQLLRGILDA